MSMPISGSNGMLDLARQQAQLIGRRRSDAAAAVEDLRATGAGDVTARIGEAGRDVETVDMDRRSKDMRDAAERFTGFFLGFMLKEMRKTVQQTPFGHGDSAERVFQELADEAYADEAAKSRINPITDLVYQSLMRGATIPAINS